MKTIPAFTIATLICSPALASEPQFAGPTLDFGDLPEISNTYLDEIHITDYAAVGDGCPEGTVDMILTPDGRSISILFGLFFVETPTHRPGPPPWGAVFGTKSCEISFDLHVPESKALRFVTYKYRGAVFPPIGCTYLRTCTNPQVDTSSVYLKTRYDINGNSGEYDHRVWSANQFFENNTFSIVNTVHLDEQSLPACGEDINITSSTSLEISGYGGSIFLDSADYANGMRYELEWIDCEL